MLLTDLLIILGGATIVATLFHSLNVPTIVGFILSGMIVGPYGLGWISSPLSAEMMIEVAAVLLMFAIGLEFSLPRIVELKNVLLGLGLAQVLGTIVVFATGTYFIVGLPVNESIFIGFFVAMSSTAIVFKILQDARQVNSPYGKNAVSILLFQDLAVIPMMLLLPLLAGSQSNFSELGQGTGYQYFGKLMLIVLIIWIGSKSFVPFMLSRVVRTRSRELFFFCIIFICIGTAFLMKKFGLTLSLGAFIAGVMISGSPYGKQAVFDLTPLRDNFLSLFFMSIGMMLDLGFLRVHINEVLALFSIVLCVKFFIVYSLVWFKGHSTLLAVVTGLLLCQIGEFSFLLLDNGSKLGLISESNRQLLLAVSTLTLGLTPILYRLAPKLGFITSQSLIIPKNISQFANKLREVMKADSSNHSTNLRGHAIIIGFGVAGKSCAQAFKSLNIPYSIIELNPQTVERYKDRERIYFGDASNLDLLHEVGIETARLAIITSTGATITEGIIRQIQSVRPDLRTIVRTEYLRELETIAHKGNQIFVVAEFETTLEILGQALKEYGIATQDAYEFITEARKNMMNHQSLSTDSLRRKICLPGWELSMSLWPRTLQEGEYLIGKTLIDVNFRQTTGASVVYVYRDGFGNTFPDSSFVFQRGDVLYLVGNEEQMQVAENYILGKEPDKEV